MALFAVVAAILLSFTSSLNATWQRGIAHNERRSAAVSAFSCIKKDLRYASLPTDVASSSLRFLINPPGIGTNYTMAQSAFWQAPSSTELSQGDLAVVGYFVQWADGTPKLCRFFANPSSSNSYLIYSSPGAWITESLLANNAPATKATDYVGQLAENVLGLWMQPLDQLQKPISKTAAGTAFSPGEFDSSKGYISSNGRTYPSALPASLEIVLITVDSRTAKRLTGTEKPPASTGNLWTDVNAFYASLPAAIRQGAEIHSTVFALANAPR
ncbi:hypothetical protein BH09VER1_BH09VER1_47170 [soil metagenome]